VRKVEKRGDTHIVIATKQDLSRVAIGASMACSGVCLTVVKKGAGWFAVTASTETLSKTTIGQWKAGSKINLERPLRVGDEFGGHIVSGHVDGVATLKSARPEGESVRMTFSIPAALAKFVAPKGSVALDGVSLTVNEVKGATFGVNIIPHTLKATGLGRLKPGAKVNFEIDLLARYVARLARK
ncbi:MAG TPA: riboflavin synthase, partial [Rhizomicrobium sp.]